MRKPSSHWRRFVSRVPRSDLRQHRLQWSPDLCLLRLTCLDDVYWNRDQARFFIGVRSQINQAVSTRARSVLRTLSRRPAYFRLFSALFLYYFISLYVFFKMLHCSRSLSPTTVIHFGIFQAWLRRERVALTVGLEFLSRRDINLYTCTLLKRSNAHTFLTPFFSRSASGFCYAMKSPSHKLFMRFARRICAAINVARCISALLWLLRYRVSYLTHTNDVFSCPHLINPTAPYIIIHVNKI